MRLAFSPLAGDRLDQALRTHTSEGSRIIQSRYFGLPNAFRHQNRERSLRDPLARKL